MPFPTPTRKLFLFCMGSLLATLGADLIAEEAAVQVYECHQGGKVTFSGTPCAGQEQRVEVDYSRPDATQAREAMESSQAAEDQAGIIAQRDLLDTEIRNLEQQITNLENERDGRVAALRYELTQGQGNQGTDTDAWMAAMNQQIVSVYNSYGDDIITHQARLGELQAQRQALGSQ